MNSRLQDLENKSIFILREIKQKFKNPVLLWSIGKDSTTLLWLCKKAFFGEMPFKVVHIDTTYKFQEIYDFREKYVKEWKLDLVIAKNEDADKQNVHPTTGRFNCCHMRKTQALQNCVAEHGFDALIVGIRRDEHGIRNKERYFSPRNKEFEWKVVREKTEKSGDSELESLQDSEFSGWDIYATEFAEGTNHVRAHPLLHWTELDIWEYIEAENIPVPDLYFAKDFKRYRSIGCHPCCKPVISKADTVAKIIAELKETKIKERDGRSQDKEDDNNMQKLRTLGYL